MEKAMNKNDEMMQMRREKEELEHDISRLNDMIKISKKIVFFGGAGVSTESGIPDFRSPNGLYRDYLDPRVVPPEVILSHTYFEEHPKEFFKFYREKMLYLTASPNRAHKKLAELEAAGKDITVVTQNVDGLHQKAGSKKVLELHGSVYRNYCTGCGQFYNVNFVANKKYPVPECSICGGIIKPDVVLYEESLREQTIVDTVKAMEEADMLIVAGTSLTVYPAASFLNYFRGRYTVVVNLSRHEREDRADIAFHQRVGDVFSRIDTDYCTDKKDTI
ncbi:transcriptional regulator Sir2 family [Ruminococcus sp. CAG:579]|jgi:NAD-dependent deacetylase|nr:transcriptional regulator Sir2 family [Ruminococcus sp. CAG:579]